MSPGVKRIDKIEINSRKDPLLQLFQHIHVIILRKVGQRIFKDKAQPEERCIIVALRPWGNSISNCFSKPQTFEFSLIGNSERRSQGTYNALVFFMGNLTSSGVYFHKVFSTFSLLTYKCIKPRNGQINFKNLAANAARFLKCVWHFWNFMH